MKDSLKAGIKHEFSFLISDAKTVPALYPESAIFRSMPRVFATGYFVGFLEWACIETVTPHIDWPSEQTVGTKVNISHIAPTPPGMNVRAYVILEEVLGRRLVFSVEAFDDVELIGKGTHERFVIDVGVFNKKLIAKS